MKEETWDSRKMVTSANNLLYVTLVNPADERAMVYGIAQLNVEHS